MEDEEAAQLAKGRGKGRGRQKRRKDEGMALATQMLLMARCDALVGSFASNVAIAVHDLQAARRTWNATRGVEAAPPPQTHDVNGRGYCGCGASFCMALEQLHGAHPEQSLEASVAGLKRGYPYGNGLVIEPP